MKDAPSTKTMESRAANLFYYLRDLAQLRGVPILSVDSYKHVVWFASVPKEKECHSPAWETGSDDTGDIWLSVQKPSIPTVPPVPAEVESWIILDSLSDYSEIPEILPRVIAPSTVEGDETEEQSTDGSSSIPQFCELSDNPQLLKLWNRYLEKLWLPWAAERQRVEPVQQVYSALHAIYQEQKRAGEAYELVVGLGLLTLRTPNDQRIKRHLVTAQASISLDPIRGTIFIEPGAEGAKLSLEQDMIDPSERPYPDMERDLEQQLRDVGDDIWNSSAMEEVLRGWLHSVSASGQFDKTLVPPDGYPESHRITLSPALILRRRNERSLIRMYEGIVSQISSGVDIPLGIQRLIDIVPDGQPIDKQTLDPGTDMEFEEILFPLPSNDEQRRIVQNLRTRQGVLVQGPPGTGKSWTIANLICHLLAHGHRVLVTSQTPRALRVLKGMLPQELATLCVSLLGNDSQSFKELEGSVRGITDRQNDWDSERNDNIIWQSGKELHELRKREADLLRQLREIREWETYQHTICKGVYHGTAQQIARRISEERPKYSWLVAQPQLEEDPPLSDKEMVELLQLHRYLGEDRLAELRHPCIEPHEIPSPEEFYTCCQSELRARVTSDSLADARGTALYAGLHRASEEARNRLKFSIDSLLLSRDNVLKYSHSWVPEAVSQIIDERDRSWRELLSISQNHLHDLIDRARAAEQRMIDLPPNREHSIVLAEAEALFEHMVKGKGLGLPGFRKKLVKDAWYLVKETRVNGRLCDNTVTLKDLIETLEVDDHLDKLWSHWSSYTDRIHASRPVQVAEIEDLCEPLEAALALYPLMEKARAACGEISGVRQPAWRDVDEVKMYSRAIEAVEAGLQLDHACVKLNGIAHLLQVRLANQEMHELTRMTHEAILSRNTEAYSQCYHSVVAWQEERNRMARRDTLHNRLASAAPLLAEQLSSEPNLQEWDKWIPHFTESWRWAQAEQWLKHMVENRNHTDTGEELYGVQEFIGVTTSKLAAAMAWGHCLDNLTESESHHLKAWAHEMKKIGKGKGKRAEIHRRAARENMEQCRGAIPAWIMPLYRVAETNDPDTDLYDVAIVDEASQSGPEALFLQFLCKKIVVVGDDKQISPDNIGVPRGEVDALREKYLRDLPVAHKSGLGVESSFFDLANIIFGGRRTLREHFRCMPEIIQFSNMHFYSNTPLEPLRQYNPDRLEPTVVACHVKDGYQKGSSQSASNPPEVEAVVKRIAECCSSPAYNGKTMGVISLLGETQARLIEQRLLAEIGPGEIEHRRLVCGDAYAFQGDERDVMFLSMVAAPTETAMHALVGKAYDQRFNVAASRAKDQMWLFHTPTVNDFRNKECLRYKLLEYCMEPKLQSTDGARERCINDFERAVYDRTVSRGYRVIPQYEIAGYFVDLMVQGINWRLAVECDGDQWHSSLEQQEHDMLRQRILMRCGLRFWRVRGSDFYYNPDGALESLWSTLSEMDAQTATGRIQTDPVADGQERGPILANEAQLELQIDSDLGFTDSVVPYDSQDLVTQYVQQPVKKAGKSQKQPPKPKPMNLRVIESQIYDYPSEFFFRLAHWAKEENQLQPWERSLIFNIGKYRARDRQISEKQENQALRIIEAAFKAGFSKEIPEKD